MKYEKPVAEYNEKGGLSKLIIGKCDSCNTEIDNFKDAYIEDKGKIYHAKNTCYKGG